MLNDKLIRIRDLIAEKERIDAELDALIAGTEAPKVKRGRKPKEKGPDNAGPQLPLTQS